MEMGQTYGGEVPIETQKTVKNAAEADSEDASEGTTTESPKEENTPKTPKTAQTAPKNASPETENESINTSPAVRAPEVSFPEGEATSSASFFARVFTAENAYPIEGAKVVVYRGDNIYAFVETDSEGRTKTVSLPAFEESNSLEEDNSRQSIDYYADVFSAGFVTQKGLLVSAVGGSDIVLNVLMIPEEEEIG